MKSSTLVLAALVAFTGFAGNQVRADSMASIAIAPATGKVTLTPRWSIGGNLSGFHFMAQDLSLTGGASNEFYSTKSTAIPSGGDITAFTFYVPGSGAATSHADIGSKLTPNSYSALTSADPDLGFGAVQLYFIHHKSDGDYFTHIVASSGSASAVADLKPMSQPGGPATGGASGYFGLTFSAANLGDGANMFYYLRNDTVTNTTRFGVMSPALAGASSDKFNLGINGHNALAFTGTDVGFGINKMYFQRLDPVTGFTIIGTLDPVSGRSSDIANLGSVYSTLTFVPGDVGFGVNNFYTTGAVNATWQSVSFAAIADRAISAGSFTVSPSASSALAIALTVVSGSTGNASISGPVGGVFTVTPTSPGLITLQATQAGQASYEYNMLRQSFTATGVATLAIGTQPTAQNATAGGTANLSVSATGATALSYQWRKAGVNITGNASATTATLTLVNVQAADSASYDVVVTNASGSLISNAVTLTVAAATAAPVITNATPTSAATVGSAFSYTIAASGSPTSYGASGLPAGLTLNTTTGVITGTPTASGTSVVTLTATNASGTATSTLTITAAGTNVAPIITSPATAPGTVGTPINYVIAATGTPTSYTAAGLPAGLTLNPSTGAITGTPSASGTSVVTITATNGAGTTSSTVTITVAAPAGSPVITSPTTAPGTAGTPIDYVIAASGTPTSYTATGLPAGLTLNPTTGAITGTPTTAGTSVVTITATNGSGTTTSTLTITVAAAPSSRIVNFSARAVSGPGSQTLIMGFVVAGDGKNLLVRGIGPTLSSFGIVNALADPMLSLFAADGTVSASNDDWQTNLNGASNATLIAATSAQVGAFALASGSKDSALLATFNNGAHTTSMVRPNSTTGVALTEIYDIDASSTSRLINVSARMNVTVGEGTLIAGLVIAGNAPKTVLIRGIGPTLSAFGVTGVLADPQIAVYSGATLVASNDNWETGLSTAAQISDASVQVGAFALAAGSKDAALLLTLQPGAYTVVVTGVGSTTGVALVEVYDTK